MEKVRITIGLSAVDDDSNEKSQGLKEKVEEILIAELTQKHGIRFASHADGEGCVDLIKTKPGGQYGFAFACTKFDDNFRESMGRSEFRYKEKEVKQAIGKIFEEIKDLDPAVKYDRGMGVFVYNIFLK